MALAKAEAAKLKEIFDDPIKWAQAFLRTFDPRKDSTMDSKMVSSRNA